MDVCGVSLWQEMARLLMEQEKKEYKKNREREKEKERERERLAMERMAMERRRQETDYRVIFHNHTHFKMWGEIFLCKSVFPLWYKHHNFRSHNFIYFFFFDGFQPTSEEVVRPRTRDEYEYQRQRNHNKPARYKTQYVFRTFTVSADAQNSVINFLSVFLSLSLSQASSASSTRLWECEPWLRVLQPSCPPTCSHQTWGCLQRYNVHVKVKLYLPHPNINI